MRVKVAGLSYAQSQMQNIQPANAEVIADSLITALQMGRHLVADDDPTRTEMDLWIQKIVLRDIDAALASAKVTFPNAESFEAPP